MCAAVAGEISNISPAERRYIIHLIRAPAAPVGGRLDSPDADAVLR